eukprot:403340358
MTPIYPIVISYSQYSLLSDYDNDQSQATERSEMFNEADLEQNSLQIDENNVTTGDDEDEEESQEFRELQRLALESEIPPQKSCGDQFLLIMNGCLSIITKGFYYLALLVYHLFTTLIAVVNSGAFVFNDNSTFRIQYIDVELCHMDICGAKHAVSNLQNLSTTIQDLSGLFEIEVTSRRQRQIRRSQRNGSNRPYSVNHRRIGRDYDRVYQQDRIRRMRNSSLREEIDVPMTELTSNIPHSIRYRISAIDNQFITEDSTERLATQGNDNHSQIDEHVLRMQRHRDQRIRRDFIRNEILRVLTSSDFERSRGGSNRNSFLLRNLQYLQMSSIARDFNENDYEMLSNLDNSNYRRISSTKTHLLISQLPTYVFLSKKTNNTDCKDTSTFNEDDEETYGSNIDNSKVKKDIESKSADKACSSFETSHKDTCTICIESFADEETIKILPCFHQFHSTCIDDWLLRKTNCPVCKFDIKQAARDERQLNYQLQEV